MSKVKTKPSRKKPARVEPPPLRYVKHLRGHRVLLPNRREVLAYCRARPFLARELPRISARARAFFGTGGGRVLHKEGYAGYRQKFDERGNLIELAYFEGLSQSEMAERMKQPLGTVKTWVRTALRALRDQLGQAAAV